MNSRSLWEAFIKQKEKRRKYGNKEGYVRGEILDSKHEAAVYRDLLIREAAKEISNLRRQVEFACVVNGKFICSWLSDFTYTENGKQVVVDAKSEATRKIAVYRIKKKLVEAIYQVEIEEV